MARWKQETLYQSNHGVAVGDAEHTKDGIGTALYSTSIDDDYLRTRSSQYAVLFKYLQIIEMTNDMCLFEAIGHAVSV